MEQKIAFLRAHPPLLDETLTSEREVIIALKDAGLISRLTSPCDVHIREMRARARGAE